MPEFNALTESQAYLLFKILELQQAAPSKRITNKTLGKELKMPESNVRRTVSDLANISEQYGYLEVYKIRIQSLPGRPKHHYRLNQKKIVTFPETAFLLIELLSFPTEKPLCVSRTKFEQHLVSVCSMEPQLAKNRIDIAIEAGYIETELDDLIYASQRVLCERPYLELLARAWSKSSN